jgi:hypothetical protein
MWLRADTQGRNAAGYEIAVDRFVYLIFVETGS